MFETPITVVGNLVNDPTRRRAGEQDVVKFRLASTARRRTDDGTWESGETLFVNVNCWGKLVTGVIASLRKGDKVIVVGSVHTSEYENRDGLPRQSLEMRAQAVGPDLSRYLVELKRVESLRDADSPAAEDAAEPTDPVEPTDAEDDDPLALTA